MSSTEYRDVQYRIPRCLICSVPRCPGPEMSWYLFCLLTEDNDNPIITRPHIVFTDEDNDNPITIRPHIVLTDGRQQRKPNHKTTTYCVYWRKTTTTQSQYDHILCVLTEDNDNPTIIQPSTSRDLDISVLGPGHFGTDLDISVLGTGQFGTWMRQYSLLTTIVWYLLIVNIFVLVVL